MGCRPFNAGGGVTGIACSRGSGKPCSACGASKATRLCDYPLRGAKQGQTCSRPICDKCTVKVGPERDYCPPHARAGEQARREIRGLTLIQPWAWAIVHSSKRVENRTWTPPPWLIGGYVAIHAGKKVDEDTVDHLNEMLDDEDRNGEILEPDKLVTGAVVGVALLAGYVSDDEAPPERFEHILESQWYSGPVGFVLEDVTPIEPVPCRGAQKFWRLPEYVLRDVRGAWKEARDDV